MGATAAALAVSVVSGIAFAYALVRLAEPVPGGSRRAGLVLVALVAAAPMGVVFSMGYSEALFCALAAWALVGVLQRQWVLAGACCAAAGLVRPTAAALIAAVGLAALVAITRRQDSWRPWAAATLAPLGSWRTWGSWRCGPGSGTAGSHCSGAGGASRSTAGLRRCASPVRYW